MKLSLVNGDTATIQQRKLKALKGGSFMEEKIRQKLGQRCYFDGGSVIVSLRLRKQG